MKFSCPICDSVFDEYDTGGDDYLHRCPSCNELVVVVEILFPGDELAFRTLYRHLKSDVPVRAVVLRGCRTRLRRVKLPNHEIAWWGLFISEDETDIFACKSQRKPWDRIEVGQYANRDDRPQISVRIRGNGVGNATYIPQLTCRLRAFAWGDLPSGSVMRHRDDDRTLIGPSATIPGTHSQNATDFQAARRRGVLPKRACEDSSH